jgi:hypothetical protein
MPCWRERLSLPEHLGLGLVDILTLSVTLSHAKVRRSWSVGLDVSSSGKCPLPPAGIDKSTTTGSRKATSSDFATLEADTSLYICGITSGAG